MLAHDQLHIKMRYAQFVILQLCVIKHNYVSSWSDTNCDDVCSVCDSAVYRQPMDNHDFVKRKWLVNKGDIL
jgi:hypothetical protein